MIITCEKCSTRFNLDDSILKAGGSKVRCSSCKQVFTAFPQVPDTPVESEPEEEIGFDIPDDATPENFDPDGFETDDNELTFEDTDFEDTSFEMDDQSFDTEKTSPEDDGIDFDLEEDIEESDPGSTDIEINFDPETDGIEEEGTLEFDGDELTFDEDDIEFSVPDLAIEGPEDSGDSENPDDLDSSGTQSFDLESLTLEVDDAPETIDDDFAADLSFDDDLEADLSFEETGPEQDLAQTLETNSSDDQNMAFPDLSMEADDQESSSGEADLELALDDDLLESTDHGMDDFDNETQSKEDLTELEEDFSSYDQVLDQDTEPAEEFQNPDMPHEEPGVTEDNLVESSRLESELGQAAEVALIEESSLDRPKLDPGRPRRRKKKSAMGGPVMLMLLLFILVAGAYIASMTLGYKIPYLSDIKIPILEKYLKTGTQEKPAAKPIPNEGSVSGRFISNDTAGELFIITGRIENPATVPYSYIQVKGTLITKGKVKAKTQIIYCGNIISEEILKTGNISDISRQMAIKEGSHNSNVNVKPGGFVPFMLVFSGLPENLENFTVEVVEL